MTTAPCPACGSALTSVVFADRWPGADLQRCQRCDSEFLWPQPNDDRLAEIYDDAYYEPWSHEREDVVRRSKVATFRPILAAAQLRPGAKLLEVGCATGEFAELAASAGYSVAGVDLNPAAIGRARERVPAARFHVGTLSDVPFAAETFDAVVMIDFIEHVRDPLAELLAARERLVPDGRIVMSTPRARSISHRVSRSRWPQYREEHLTYLSTEGMRALLRRAGLRVHTMRATTKRLSLSYLYGQAIAYPVPVLTTIVTKVWPVLPVPKHRPLPMRFGEMTVVAERL